MFVKQFKISKQLVSHIQISRSTHFQHAFVYVSLWYFQLATGTPSHTLSLILQPDL